MIRAFLRWLALPLLRDYLAVMHMAKLREAGLLTAEAERYGKLLLYWGLFLDCAYNLTWAWAYFRDRPRELLVTQRLKRYKHGRAYRLVRDGWRLRAVRILVAPRTDWRLDETEWLAKNFLDPADPDGKHV